MSALAPTLQAFFADRLARQRQASAHTIAAYRDTMRLLLAFAAERVGKQPSVLEIDDLDAPLIGSFLDHLEHERGNSVRTRNARLAAIRSLFRYAALRHPEHAAAIERVLAIPPKRFERALVTFLTEPELGALLAAPDRATWTGRRDHALLLMTFQTGLRVSELTALRVCDLSLSTGAHARVTGKGRKERGAMLTAETVAVLREWCRERKGEDGDPLFRRGAEDRSPPRRLPGCLTSTPPQQLAAARHWRARGRPVVPLPDGDRYLGFLFARGASADAVERSLRDAHACLRIRIEPLAPEPVGAR